MAELKNELLKYEEKRKNILLRLGEIKYEEIRVIDSDKSEIKKLVENLVKIDISIFDIRKELIKESKENFRCGNCKELIGAGDSFCNRCGEELQVIKKKSTIDSCKVCKNKIYDGDKFCGRCGVRV